MNILLAQDTESTVIWPILIIALVLMLLLVALVAIFAFRYQNDGKKKHFLEESYYNVRIYTYDYAKHVFTCFDKTNVLNTKSFTDGKFLDQFTPSDKYLVSDWLHQAACSLNDNYEKTLQAEVKIRSKNKNLTSILEITEINRDAHIIHFRSHIIPYVVPLSAREKSKDRKNSTARSSRFFLSSEEEAARFVKGFTNDYIGALYYIKLFYKEAPENIKSADKKYLDSFNKIILSELIPFLSSTRRLVKINPTEEIIIDSECQSREEALSRAGNLHTMVQKKINATLNDAPHSIHVAIGIAIGSTFLKEATVEKSEAKDGKDPEKKAAEPKETQAHITHTIQDYALAKEQAQKIAQFIPTATGVDECTLYTPTFFEQYQEEKKAKTDVTKVLINGTFRIFYSPTLDIDTKTQSFYLLDILPYGTDSDILEIMNMANTAGADVLFQKLNEKILRTITRYGSSTEKTRLAIQIPYKKVTNFEKIMQDTSEKVEWIIIFDENDMLATISKAGISMAKVAPVLETMNRLHSEGFALALNIKNTTPVLHSSIIQKMDYYFINLALLGVREHRKNNDMRTIQVNYAPYGKTIVFTGLKSHEDIEIATHYGGTVFECSSIQSASSRTEVLDMADLEDLMKDLMRLTPKLNFARESKTLQLKAAAES